MGKRVCGLLVMHSMCALDMLFLLEEQFHFTHRR